MGGICIGTKCAGAAATAYECGYFRAGRLTGALTVQASSDYYCSRLVESVASVAAHGSKFKD